MSAGANPASTIGTVAEAGRSMFSPDIRTAPTFATAHPLQRVAVAHAAALPRSGCWEKPAPSARRVVVGRPTTPASSSDARKATSTTDDTAVRASLELGGVVSLPATTRRADGAGFSQQLLLASAAACAASSRWNACVVANGGVARMAGENIERPELGEHANHRSRDARALHATPRSPRLRQRMPRTAWSMSHAGRGPSITSPFWTAPRFAGAIGVDAGVRFW